MDTDLTFEDALDQLESIVDDLERGEPELSSALAKYERGVRILAHCHALLDGADRTVALLSGVDDEGNPQASPFDATATADRADPVAPAPSPSEDDVVPF
jgi:exodeoxyribonuclease VII small subunit